MREIIADSRMMHIGKNGEGDALRVVFQVVAEWEALYGAGGVWTLNVQRNGDALAYAAQDFTIEDGAALWVVTDADAAVVGEGRCELTYKIGGTVAKSRTYAFRVDLSLTGGGDVPDPVKGWQETLEERVDGKLDRPDGGSEGDVLTKTGDGEEWKKPTGENVVYIAKTGTDTYAVKRNASDENPMPFAELLAMAKAPSTTVAVFDRYRLPLAALTDTGMIFESVYSATVFTVLVMQDNSAYQQSVTVMSAPLTDALKIPAWALSENKPTYTASEVGAVASQQAVSDAGKVLTVGDDGKVVPKAAGGTDISLGLTSAQVGQIVKVKAVDDNGKPTQWEAGEMTGGGASAAADFTLVGSATLTETASSISITLTKDCDEIIAAYYPYGSAENGSTVVVPFLYINREIWKINRGGMIGVKMASAKMNTDGYVYGYTQVRCKVDGNAVVMEKGEQTSMKVDVGKWNWDGTYMMDFVGYTAKFDDFTTVTSKKIKNVSMQTWNAVFGVGTTLMVWGR